MKVFLKLALSLFTALMVTTALSENPASAQNFAGKTIEIIVPYGTGGATDLGARAFSRVLPAYLEGKPTVIVRNMPGGGGLVGVNYLGEVAKPDGLTILIWTWNPIVHLLKESNLRVRLDEYQPVGGLHFGEVAFMRADAAPSYKEPADFIKIEPLWFGGLGPSNFKDIMGRLELDLLGAKYKYIGSYNGSQDIVLAIQRNELHFTRISSASWRGQIAPNLEKNGIVRAVYQGGHLSGNTMLRDAELPNLPTFEEFYFSIHGKQPSGKKWEMYSFLRDMRSAFSDAVLLPPKTPAPIVGAIQKAFLSATKDPAFIADYEKIAQAKPVWADGASAEKVFARLRSADESVGVFLAEYIAAVAKRN
jgi:tripartite-type tricarboxylate transporter receptor subunit TctC